MNVFRRFLSRNRAAKAAAAVAASTALPAEVATVIAASTVADRSTDEQARVLVFAPGYGSFVYGRDTAREWLKTTFRDLNETQLSRALHMLHAHVTRTQAAVFADAAMRQASRSSWRDWRPLDK